jgi:hypothetical protein
MPKLTATTVTNEIIAYSCNSYVAEVSLQLSNASELRQNWENGLLKRENESDLSRLVRTCWFPSMCFGSGKL